MALSSQKKNTIEVIFHDCTHMCTKKMIMAYKWVKTSNPALQREISLLSDLSSFILFFLLVSETHTHAYHKHTVNKQRLPSFIKTEITY